MLGRLIDDLGNPDTLFGLVAALDAPDLLARIGRAASAAGDSPSHYITTRVRAFVDEAPDDTWVQLIGIMNRAEDPALAAIAAILEAVLPAAAEASASETAS